MISVIGPAAAEIVARRPAGPEHAHRPAELGGDRLPSPSPPTRRRPDRSPAARPRAALEALAAAGAEPVTEEAAEIVRVESGRPALRARDDDRDDPPGGGDQRARGQLHQGLLHRPGDGRPAALQGQAEPPPARAAPRRRRPPPAIRCGSASASWARSEPPSSPPRAGPIALAILRREAEPGTTVEVGERRRGRGRRAPVLRRSPNRGGPTPGSAASARVAPTMGVRGGCSSPARRALLGRAGPRRLRRGGLREQPAPAGADRAQRPDRRRRGHGQPAGTSAPGWRRSRSRTRPRGPSDWCSRDRPTRPATRSSPAAPAR